jgi:hypothetical protein
MKHVDIWINFKIYIYDVEDYVHTIWRIQYQIHTYDLKNTTHWRGWTTIDGPRWMDICGRMSMDGRWWIDGRNPDVGTRCQNQTLELDVKTRWTGLDVKTRQTRPNWLLHNDDDIVERSTSASSATMACRRKERFLRWRVNRFTNCKSQQQKPFQPSQDFPWS